MKKPNILFILLDALRADHLGCYGYNKPTSPMIDYIAKKGLIFSNCFSTTNTTDPSVTSIFSGLYPRSHGIVHHSYKVTDEEIESFNKRGIKLLPEILKEKGYTTFGLDWLGRWHQKGYDYYHGINTSRTSQKKLIGEIGKVLKKISLYNITKKIYQLHFFRKLFGKIELYGNDPILTKKTIELIKNTKATPFFIFLHYYDTHAPYVCSRKYKKRFYDSDTKLVNNKSFGEIKNLKMREFYEKWTKKEKNFANIIARYDGSIRHLDDQIKEIMYALKQSGKLNDTLIVITSDHGENLTENEILFDHHGLYEGSLKVPLIIALPDNLPKKNIKALVQHVDIMPTLLSILKIDQKIEFDGFDMMGRINNEHEVRDFVYAEEVEFQKRRCIRTKNFKLIFPIDPNNLNCSRCGVVHGGGTAELYDVQKDPNESKNIFPLNNELAVKLEGELNNFLEALDNKALKKENLLDYKYNKTLPKEDEEKVKARLKRLESMGYLD